MTKRDDFLRRARDRMDEAITADLDNRQEGLDDRQKLVGRHWDDKIRREREAENKPCITVNQLPQHLRQVTGDLRRMNPAINITAADDAANPDTAEIMEGMVRQIEYASDASSVYENTASSAAASSIGWFRVVNDWEDDDSFLQEIKIKAIRDPDSVYCDPSAEMPDRSDANYIFITESMSADDFEAEYPNKKMADIEHDGTTDKMQHWRKGEEVIVAEYFYKKPVTFTIGQLADGSIIRDPKAIHNVVRKREVKSHEVKWAKISGVDVLEEQDIPCRYIPVIAVTGEEWVVGDRVHRSSVVRYAKDPQQLLDYWVSANAEVTALQPKAPYMVTPRQIQGYESMWAAANQANRPYLVFNPDERHPGAPQRIPPPISSQAIQDQIMLASDFIKSTTGIYDAGLGNDGNEKSGVAIRQRQMESDVSTSIYADNMAKAIAQCGRIIVDMIPKVYDTARTVRVLGKDSTEKRIPINGVQLVNVNGRVVPQSVNDVTTGKYDVRVSVGPNYATRRQETQEGMLEFIKAIPQAANVTGDLIAKSMDWPDADQFAERLKRVLPPNVRGEDEMEPAEQQAMAQQKQAQQMAQKLQMQDVATKQKKEAAEAREAEADAERAKYEAEKARLEVAQMSGQISEAIRTEVARHIQALTGPRPSI